MDLIDRQQVLEIKFSNGMVRRGVAYVRVDELVNKLKALPTIQPVATDTNVGGTISRKGVFIPNITVEMFRNASLEGVEDLMASGEMEDISLPSAQPELKWIPCSERCPEENGYYLTTTINKEVYCDYWSYDHFDRTEAVVAWIKLPEPYAERRTDG